MSHDRCSNNFLKKSFRDIHTELHNKITISYKLMIRTTGKQLRCVKT